MINAVNCLNLDRHTYLNYALATLVFRATGITNYLENAGTLEVAQRIDVLRTFVGISPKTRNASAGLRLKSV
jgi:hypothetical protein